MWRVLRGGSPLLPYQRDIVDTIGETDQAGRYRHGTVVLLLPRQCGKTTLAFSIALGRGRTYRDYRAVYMAQTGHQTTRRFGELFDLITSVPSWQRTWATRRSSGTEHVRTLPTGSALRASPPQGDKLRGSALDLVIVDEAQEHGDDVGLELDAGIIPTFTTRPRSQLLIVGTAGTADSAYFRRHYDAAAAGTPGYLLLEVGAAPDGVDPADPATWWEHHPGLQAGLTTEDNMRRALSVMGPTQFAREYLNRWATTTDHAVIDAAAWDRAARTTTPEQPRRGLYVAYDAAWDRSSAAVVAAWVDDDQAHLEVIAHRPGVTWLLDYLTDLHRRRRPTLATDTATPAKDITSALRTRRVQVTEVGTPDYTAACAELAAAVTTGTVDHPDDPALTAAVRAARSRPIGDRWVFDRRTAHDLSPLAAAAVAHWHARRPVAPPVLV